MKQAELTKIGIGLLLLAGLTAAGCGLRDARNASPDGVDAPALVETDSPEPPMEPAPETAPAPAPSPSLEPTAEAVAIQEAELELAEAELSELMQELDRKMFELEARELELNREPNEWPASDAWTVAVMPGMASS